MSIFIGAKVDGNNLYFVYNANVVLKADTNSLGNGDKKIFVSGYKHLFFTLSNRKASIQISEGYFTKYLDPVGSKVL